MHRPILIIIAVILWSASPALAQFGGQIVFDPSMFARQLQQLNQEIQEARSMTQEVQYTIKNMTGGSAGVWDSNRNFLDSLGSIIDAANGLSYQSAELTERFQQLYPGYAVQSSNAPTMQQSVDVDLNTLNGTLQTAQAQAQQWQAEQATLNTLELKNQTALGNLQVAETGNEISLATVNLLENLQQIAMANLNSQNVNAANSVSNQALSQMTTQAIVGAPPQVVQMEPVVNYHRNNNGGFEEMNRITIVAIVISAFIGSMAGYWYRGYVLYTQGQKTAMAITGAPPQVVKMLPEGAVPLPPQ